jgi:hypothetical protein
MVQALEDRPVFDTDRPKLTNGPTNFQHIGRPRTFGKAALSTAGRRNCRNAVKGIGRPVGRKAGAPAASGPTDGPTVAWPTDPTPTGKEERHAIRE